MLISVLCLSILRTNRFTRWFIWSLLLCHWPRSLFNYDRSGGIEGEKNSGDMSALIKRKRFNNILEQIRPYHYRNRFWAARGFFQDDAVEKYEMTFLIPYPYWQSCLIQPAAIIEILTSITLMINKGDVLSTLQSNNMGNDDNSSVSFLFDWMIFRFWSLMEVSWSGLYF